MTLLQARGLTKTYPGARRIRALDDVSFEIAPGETLGLIGPSGCGKSTIARVLTRLTEPDAGTIQFDGQDWGGLKGRTLRRARGAMQMVFQDPGAAFHPRATVSGALCEPLRLHAIAPRSDWPDHVERLLTQVGLSPELAPRPLSALSGGQRQRVAIARAIAPRPKLIVLDEAVSALDASVRARVLDLLAQLQREMGLAYLFVSHDLAVTRALSHRIAVMEAGRIVETGPAEALLAAPRTEILRRLIAAVPTIHTEKVSS
ncbi:peptide ABC transporter ATP-binding protein [Rhodovulum sp. BSW8]|uniref:Peptide/nickel transport system ATP-binding protein n=1 Tax=Rhodovulum visakhapatnamense TaxID=364297 RepID=A0A4R8FFJ1_9RHOB|nr:MULTISPECIES: ATP-binding cassette domain-containing protein [Rhodovulum]RBO54335.1 peptide ABC transporter ATP-binding protein [Rhodovulum sp. BSW8]TDX22568.1 peptide/nickel transport system ATP-binding protein [Rhodovulum visakhapatnamense]